MSITMTRDQWLQVLSAIDHRIWDLKPIADNYGPASLTRKALEECKSIKAHIERNLTGEQIADQR